MKVVFRGLDANGGEEEVGSIHLKNGKAVATPANSHFLTQVVHALNKEENIEHTLKWLPHHYKSAYMRAELVEEKNGVHNEEQVENSNPEGINQYTKAAGDALKRSNDLRLRYTGLRDPESKSKSSLANGALEHAKTGDHPRAAAIHREIADLTEGNESLFHNAAALAHDKALKLKSKINDEFFSQPRSKTKADERVDKNAERFGMKQNEEVENKEIEGFSESSVQESLEDVRKGQLVNHDVLGNQLQEKSFDDLIQEARKKLADNQTDSLPEGKTGDRLLTMANDEGLKGTLEQVGQYLANLGSGMPGYGQVLMKMDGSRVWYVAGTEDEENFDKVVKHNLGAIVGEDNIEYRQEQFPPRDGTWVQVYPPKKKAD